MANTITVKIRDTELVSKELSDADEIFYLSLAFNEEERDLLKRGKMRFAIEAFGNRQKTTLEEALNNAESEDDRASVTQRMDEELASYIFYQINWNQEVRSQVCWRLIETFPGFPNKWVSYQDSIRNTINLSCDEVMILFLSIINHTLVNVQQKQQLAQEKKIGGSDTKELNEEDEKANALKDLWAENDRKEKALMLSNREARLAQLKAEIEALEAV